MPKNWRPEEAAPSLGRSTAPTVDVLQSSSSDSNVLLSSRIQIITGLDHLSKIDMSFVPIYVDFENFLMVEGLGSFSEARTRKFFCSRPATLSGVKAGDLLHTATENTIAGR